MEPFSTDARRIGICRRGRARSSRQRVATSRSLVERAGRDHRHRPDRLPGDVAEHVHREEQYAGRERLADHVRRRRQPDPPVRTARSRSSQVGVDSAVERGREDRCSRSTRSPRRPTAPLSLGIGTNLGGQPDWTFADNASRYTQREADGVRPNVGRRADRVAAGPAADPAGQRRAAPTCRWPDGSPIRRTTGAAAGDQQWEDRHVHARQSRSFRFTPRIKAGLQEYTFELRALWSGIDRVVARRTVSSPGDVYVVQGQSNAEAAKYNGAASGEESPYLRSFGTPTSDGQPSPGPTGSGITRPVT